MKRTSLEAYQQIREEGILAEQQFKVFEALCLHGPQSGQMLVETTGCMSAWKRCSELKRMGLIKEHETTAKCLVTGRMVYFWEVVLDPEPVAQPELAL